MSYSSDTTHAAGFALAVTPNNDTDLEFGKYKRTRAIYVGTQGDLEVIMAYGGNTIVFPNVIGWLPIQVKRVLSNNTTADDIIAVW